MSVFPWAQYATRNKRYKLVETEQIDCTAPLGPNDPKPYPWAEYKTKPVREFYDIARKQTNPTGMDIAAADKLKNCPEGRDPKTCLPKALRPTYVQLSNAMGRVRNSATAQANRRSLGDGNQDLRVNNADLEGWKTYRGKGPSQYDINLDARTNAADRAIIEANLGTDCMNQCTRADLNRNGIVDAKDQKLLGEQMGVCDPVLCSGDLNGDGAVTTADVNLMIQLRVTCNAARRKASRSP